MAVGVAGVVLPPLYFALRPGETVALPPPGRRVAVAEGVSVNVLERGAGPPVVLIHGLPGTGYYWEQLAGMLAAHGRRVLAYDRVGYGRSDPRPDDDFTVEANARELLALLEAEDLRDVTVVGWSFGGKTAQTAALLDPSRMGRLVLVASAGRWDDPPPPNPVISVLTSRPVTEWAVSIPPLQRSLQRGMGRQFFSDQPVPDWFVPYSRASMALRQTRDTWRQEARRFRFDGPDPAGIERPILLLHGDDDRITPLVIAQEIHARAPRSELVVVPGGSHALPITHPERVSAHIARFQATR